MDLIKGIHYGKSSPEVRRKPSFFELQRPICGATRGDSKNRLYFWNPRVEGYASIYIYMYGLEILESEDIY